MNKVKTYFYPREIELSTLTGNRINFAMLRKPIKAFRNINNDLEFILTDADRKPIKLVNRDITIFIINPENDEVLLKRCVEILDEEKGKYILKLDINDTQEWQEGIYHMSAVMRDECGRDQMLFTDTDQNAIIDLIFESGALPNFSPATKILTEDFQFARGTDLFGGPVLQGTFTTGRFPGSAFFGRSDGLHTAAVYTDDFSGKFWIQGSIEENPNLDGDFFDIPIGINTPYFSFLNSTAVTAFAFKGAFTFVRFKHLSDASAAGIPDAFTPDAIPQVLYKV